MMEVAYVLIAVIFATLILLALYFGRELEDLSCRILMYAKDDEAQMDINESLLKQQDRMLSRIGDLNTRVIELEARIPEPEYISTDEDQVELGIDEYYSEKVEAED